MVHRVLLILALAAGLAGQVAAPALGGVTRDSTDRCSQFGSGGGVITGVSVPSGVNAPSGTAAALVCSGKFTIGRWSYDSRKLDCASASGYPYALAWGGGDLGNIVLWGAGWDFWASSASVRWDGIAFASGGPGTAEKPGTTTIKLHNWDPFKSHQARVWALCGTKANQGNDNGCCIAVFQGTPAADLLLGTRRSDRILGLGGPDRLLGLAGNDLVEGGIGGDTLLGGSNADRLLGATGADLLDGGDGFDTLEGGPGPDRLRDSQGPTAAVGGAGDDTIDVRDGDGDDRVSCGAGTDRVMADRRDRVAADCRP